MIGTRLFSSCGERKSNARWTKTSSRKTRALVLGHWLNPYECQTSQSSIPYSFVHIEAESEAQILRNVHERETFNDVKI